MKVAAAIDRAARVLIYLAGKGAGAYCPIEEIEPAGVDSLASLEGILGPLGKAGLVRTRRRGGRKEVCLRRPADRIHLGMVLRALEEGGAWGLAPSRPDDKSGEAERPTLPAWKEVERVMLGSLHAYTLDHLAWDTLFYLEP